MFIVHFRCVKNIDTEMKAPRVDKNNKTILVAVVFYNICVQSFSSVPIHVIHQPRRGVLTSTLNR